MPKTRIAVIYGSKSGEHEVSLVSASNVIDALDKEKYEVIRVFISKELEWFLDPKGDQSLLAPYNPMDLKKDADFVLPILHGPNGEDGTIQGLLELLKIPYVGCKVLGSCVCMDKAYTKVILEKAKINQAKYVYIKKIANTYAIIDEEFNETELNLKEICGNVATKLGFPVFVKPSNSGSSVGIRKANNLEELLLAIEHAGLFDSKIIIEEGIDAREIECAVIGNETVSASCVGEILPAEDFYSFNAKYNNSDSRVEMPANLPEELSEEIRQTAVKAYKAVDAKGLARVDFFVERNTNKIILNEINTMPGFTTISMYPQLWEKCGKPYSELLDELINLAINN